MARHSATVNPNNRSTAGRPTHCVTHAPRILLAEDDGPSGQFLRTALEAMGAQVVVCVDGDAALQAATDAAFDLLLLDRRLPRRSGEAVLQRLRGDPGARSHASRAAATSARWTAQRSARALAAGFVAVLDKPCSTADLRHLLQQHLPTAAQALRDDDAALAAAGSAANLAALRRLLARDLAQWHEDWPSLVTQPRELDARLHRLCAAAGFCGTPALASAARALRDALAAQSGIEAAGTTFLDLLEATREQLRT